MNVWVLVGVLLAVFIVLPAVGVVLASGWVKIVSQIVLSVVLGVILIASLILSYICFRAQARKWGSGLLISAFLLAFFIYMIWAGIPFF